MLGASLERKCCYSAKGGAQGRKDVLEQFPSLSVQSSFLAS